MGTHGQVLPLSYLHYSIEGHLSVSSQFGEVRGNPSVGSRSLLRAYDPTIVTLVQRALNGHTWASAAPFLPSFCHSKASFCHLTSWGGEGEPILRLSSPSFLSISTNLSRSWVPLDGPPPNFGFPIPHLRTSPAYNFRSIGAGLASVVFGDFPSPLRRFPFKVHGHTWGSSSFYLGLFAWFQGRAVHPHNLGRQGGTHPMAHVVLLSPPDSHFLHTSAPGGGGAPAGSGALRLTHEMAHVTFRSAQRWAQTARAGEAPPEGRLSCIPRAGGGGGSGRGFFFLVGKARSLTRPSRFQAKPRPGSHSGQVDGRLGIKYI